MHANSLVATEDKHMYFADIMGVEPIQVPTPDVIRRLEEIEDGTFEPVLTLYPGNLVVPEEDNLRTYFALHFLRYSLIRVKYELPKGKESPKASRSKAPRRVNRPTPTFNDFLRAENERLRTRTHPFEVWAPEEEEE